MRKKISLTCFLIVVLALAQNSRAQNTDQHEMFFKAQLRNAKILFNKNQGRKAIRILEYIHRQEPKNGEVNYLLSILYLKVKKDLRGMKKWYRLAQKINRDYVSPIKLSDSQIKALFEPQRISTVDINLQTIFQEAEKNLQRGKWDEAKNIFKSGTIYYPEAGSSSKNTFNLLGAYIYNHYDSLYNGLKYYSLINPASLLQEKYKKMYRELKPKWERKYAVFKKEFSKRRAALARVTTLIEKRKYKSALVFIDLVAPFFRDDIQYIGLFNLYKLEANVALDRLNESRKLSDALRMFITSRNLPPTYMDKLNALETQLIYKESKIRIGRKIAEIDSMMLKGFIKDGLNSYSNLLKQQETKKLNSDFIYLSLARVMKNVGHYDDARKYLKKVSSSPGNQSFINALTDTIVKSEQFEKRWHGDMPKVLGFYRLGEYEAAHKTLFPLLVSPYLRYGLKDSTYSMMSKIYLGLGKIAWAKRMAVYAGKYASKTQESFVQSLAEKQRENPLCPQLSARQRPFYVLFKHPQSVQMILQPLKAGDVYAQHPPNKLSAQRLVPGQPGRMLGAKTYLVDSGEKTSFNNYIVGMGAMLASILFINTR